MVPSTSHSHELGCLDGLQNFYLMFDWMLFSLPLRYIICAIQVSLQKITIIWHTLPIFLASLVGLTSTAIRLSSLLQVSRPRNTLYHEMSLRAEGGASPVIDPNSSSDAAPAAVTSLNGPLSAPPSIVFPCLWPMPSGPVSYILSWSTVGHPTWQVIHTSTRENEPVYISHRVRGFSQQYCSSHNKFPKWLFPFYLQASIVSEPKHRLRQTETGLFTQSPRWSSVLEWHFQSHVFCSSFWKHPCCFFSGHYTRGDKASLHCDVWRGRGERAALSPSLLSCPEAW